MSASAASLEYSFDAFFSSEIATEAVTAEDVSTMAAEPPGIVSYSDTDEEPGPPQKKSKGCTVIRLLFLVIIRIKLFRR